MSATAPITPPLDAAWGRPVILGILNVTPDSFSDGGEHADAAVAVEHGVRMIAAGADVIDVGGESTRPGAERLTPAEEQRRVLRVIEGLRDRGVPVSIDTMNAGTAELAVDRGAVIINDVSGGTADARMPDVAAASEVLFVAMHSRGTSATMNSLASYDDLVGEVRAELEARTGRLLAAGVASERIILDPGLGFAKTEEQNWQLLGALREVCGWGHPVLVGASRKRFLGRLLPDGAPASNRDAATSVVSALSADAGAWGVRVHDVAATKLALDVWSHMNGTRS